MTYRTQREERREWIVPSPASLTAVLPPVLPQGETMEIPTEAVRLAIFYALTEAGIDRGKACTAALMGMYAVQADLNGTEFHLQGN
jgi:hypothetical protein